MVSRWFPRRFGSTPVAATAVCSFFSSPTGCFLGHRTVQHADTAEATQTHARRLCTSHLKDLTIKTSDLTPHGLVGGPCWGQQTPVTAKLRERFPTVSFHVDDVVVNRFLFSRSRDQNIMQSLLNTHQPDTAVYVVKRSGWRCSSRTPLVVRKLLRCVSWLVLAGRVGKNISRSKKGCSYRACSRTGMTCTSVL